MSNSRRFIYWDHEWHQVLYWLRLWVRVGASFIETTSGYFFYREHMSEFTFYVLNKGWLTTGGINREPGLINAVNQLNIKPHSWHHKWNTCDTMSGSRCFIDWDQIILLLRSWVRQGILSIDIIGEIMCSIYDAMNEAWCYENFKKNYFSKWTQSLPVSKTWSFSCTLLSFLSFYFIIFFIGSICQSLPFMYQLLTSKLLTHRFMTVKFKSSTW
jgi:hypothetical protein